MHLKLMNTKGQEVPGKWNVVFDRPNNSIVRRYEKSTPTQLYNIWIILYRSFVENPIMCFGELYRDNKYQEFH